MTAAPMLPERHDWTVDDLGDLSKEFRHESMNGRPIEPSDSPAHQDLCIEVALALRAHCPPHLIVTIDQSLRVNRRIEARPDVVAVGMANYATTPVPVEDAILAVDIVSVPSEFREIVETAEVHSKAGIATYWVLDQMRSELSLTELILDPARKRYSFGLHTTDVFTVTEPWPITIDLPALSSRRTALLARANKPAD
ncbi:MAG TPA: Uma2 family endonuclease [Pilimelia sp.]|nr:Uma2 family endonuclease [Pilimelia sp.]